MLSALFRRQLIQLLGLDDLPVEGRVFGVAAVGHGHEVGVIDHRHGKFGGVGGVDLVLVDLYVHLAHGAGGGDHIGAVVVGRLDDALDHFLGFFGLGEGEGAAAALDLFLVAGDGFGAEGVDHLVQIDGVFEGFAGDAEGAVGLTAHVAGDLDAFEGLFDLLAHFLIADVFDQDFDHVFDGGFVLEFETGLGQGLVGLGHEALVFFETLGGLAGGEPAGGAGGDQVLARLVFFGEGDVARREGESGQFAAAGVADGGGATVPVRDFVELDVQLFA